MANGTDCRAGAAKSLRGKKLLPVTTHTSVVIWKVSHIGKFAFGIPRGRNFVAGVAGEALMFFRSMQEGRVLRGRSTRRLRLGRWSCRRRPAPSLRYGDRSDSGGKNHDEKDPTFHHVYIWSAPAKSRLIGTATALQSSSLRSAGALQNYLHAGSGLSITSHLTFGSVSFDKVNGRRIAIARSVALTSRSQIHRMLLFSVSAPARFEIM